MIPRPAAQDQPRRPGLRAAFGRTGTGPTHRTRDASKGPRRRFGKKGQISPLLTVDGVTPPGVDLHADSTESIAGPLASARPRYTYTPAPPNTAAAVCAGLSCGGAAASRGSSRAEGQARESLGRDDRKCNMTRRWKKSAILEKITAGARAGYESARPWGPRTAHLPLLLQATARRLSAA